MVVTLEARSSRSEREHMAKLGMGCVCVHGQTDLCIVTSDTPGGRQERWAGHVRARRNILRPISTKP
jgi:hypothetical protein